MKELIYHRINNYKTFRGVQYNSLDTSYQIFGRALHTAPIVLVNHALTGNSDVLSKEHGWWKELVGDCKLIDTCKYTVIAFNILGNGYDNIELKNYKDFVAKDIARINYLVLKDLKVQRLFAAIGGSLGGGILWEMTALYPNFMEYVIPIATDWKSTDWIIGHNAIQESILLNSINPLQLARKMAILFYRTPHSIGQKFNRLKRSDSDIYQVESWLNHHGKKLEDRFSLQAYLAMNHFLSSINISSEEGNLERTLAVIESKVIQIAVDSDLFFIREENLKTKELLDKLGVVNEYHEIKSIDGHDSFLIEHEQISEFLEHVF